MTNEKDNPGPGPVEGKDPDTSGDPDPKAEEPRDLYMNRYELTEVVGRGGTCTVFRAWDTRLQRYVAIKRLEDPLLEDAHSRARFNREGRAIARLSHPHLVTLIDRGSTEDEEYLVFEYVEGRSLKDLIREGGPLEPRDAVHITGQVAEGLAQAHRAGIVHRDVKPQNILLDAEGRAKLTDFGIATGADLTKVTRVGAIIGSGRYMSPEQVQGRPVDGRSDVYSLGIVLYEMLTGSPPFDATSMADIGRQHVKDRPALPTELRPDLPPALSRVVMRCLEKLPESRFQSMDELLGAFVGLDLYRLERTSGGLVENLRRVGLGRRERSGESGEWTPPPLEPADDAMPEPPRDRVASGSRGGETPSRRTATGRRVDRRREPSRSNSRYLWAALLAGVVAVIVLAGLLLFSGPGDAPDAVGLALDEAKAQASEEGLDLEAEVVPSFDTAATVIAQDPAPGENAPGGVLRVTATKEPEAVSVADLTALDPEGDQEEHSEELNNLTDDQADTAWSSEGYGTANFGATGKSGVGVSFTLSGAATLVRLQTGQTGWQGSLQVQDSGGAWQPLGELGGEDTQTLTLEQPITAGRIWITALPPEAGEGGRHRVSISELGFYR